DMQRHLNFIEGHKGYLILCPRMTRSKVEPASCVLLGRKLSFVVVVFPLYPNKSCDISFERNPPNNVAPADSRNDGPVTLRLIIWRGVLMTGTCKVLCKCDKLSLAD